LPQYSQNQQRAITIASRHYRIQILEIRPEPDVAVYPPPYPDGTESEPDSVGFSSLFCTADDVHEVAEVA